jgi:hypothetical protein
MSFAVQCKASSEPIVKEVTALFETLGPLANTLGLEGQHAEEEDTPRAVIDRLTPLVKQAEAVEPILPRWEKCLGELSRIVAPLNTQFLNDLVALRELAEKLKAAQQ